MISTKKPRRHDKYRKKRRKERKRRLAEETKSDGYGKYYYAPQPTTYQNEYFYAVSKRTSKELSLYYRNLDYVNPSGYKSELYGQTYYDGYGYNFYNGNYGYYEYSRPPSSTPGPPWSAGTFAIFLGTFTGVLLLFIAMQYFCFYAGPKVEDAPDVTRFKRAKSPEL